MSPAASTGEARSPSALWPLLVVLLLFWTTVGALTAASLARTDGRFVYALDDPYIHMAMAKNLALHGVWGVTSDGFTSSSSSIAWTATLALLFKIFGVRDVIPFALNLLIATVTIVLTHQLLRRRLADRGPAAVGLALLVFTFATPLPALVFAGQEHIVHVLCTLAFVFAAVDLVSGARAPLRSRRFLTVATLALVLPLVRYEGMYPILAAAVLLSLRRRSLEAALLVVAGGAPIATYAAVSVTHGWWAAPNSVLLKGNLPDWRTLEGVVDLLGYSGYSTLLTLPAVAFLVYGAIALYAWRAADGWWQPPQVMLAMFVATGLLHLQYSQPRAFWLFRYEAYVIALGVVTISVALAHRREAVPGGGTPRGLVPLGALSLLLLISPLTDRAVKSIARVPGATANIYEQQYQVGRFLREYYPEAPAALNDIGAPAYLADAKVLDLVGLASMDVARLRRAGWFSPPEIQQLARDHEVRLAVVYDNWFRGALPPEWIKAGAWKIRNPVVVGGDTVSFYATRPDEYLRLLAHLRDFEPDLPAGVTATLGRR